MDPLPARFHRITDEIADLRAALRQLRALPVPRTEPAPGMFVSVRKIARQALAAPLPPTGPGPAQMPGDQAARIERHLKSDVFDFSGGGARVALRPHPG